MTLFNKNTTIQTIRLLRDAGFLTKEAFDANGEIHPAVLAQFNFQGETINLEKCCARVASGGQCTKKRVNGDFCKSHARLLSECKATKNWPNPSQTSKCVGCSREAGFLVSHQYFWEHSGRVDVDLPDWHWMKTGRGFKTENYVCIDSDTVDKRIDRCWSCSPEQEPIDPNALETIKDKDESDVEDNESDVEDNESDVEDNESDDELDSPCSSCGHIDQNMCGCGDSECE